MSKPYATNDGSGERPGYRDSIDRMAKRMVDNGTPAAEAERLARRAHQRVEKDHIAGKIRVGG